MSYLTMKKLTVVLFLAVPGCLVAQSSSDWHKNNATFDFGPAMPNGSAYLSTAPVVGFSYGYRLVPYFQADANFNIAFGAANNQNAVQTDVGAVQGGDHELMMLLGGRFILPTHLKKLEFGAGGGAAYLHYSETAPSGGGYYGPSTCYTCTSRGGWGGYGLGNVTYYLDSNHNFRVGATVEFISASTNGQVVGNIPAVATTDHWVNLLFEFGLSF